MRPGNTYLGIDVGSVTTKFAVIDADGNLVASLYLRTGGQPVSSLQRGLKQLSSGMPQGLSIAGVATTGSGRYLAGTIVQADLVKNEISCQAAAAVHFLPEASTIIEIGGQDSKIITVDNGMVYDMAMNTVCAAGTGSFLDQQAQRMNLAIEDFGSEALKGTKPVHISGRCAVFAESDMIHKQQMGYRRPDIIRGMCRCLARNYMSNVAAGKRIHPPVVFQGGVAFNPGMVLAIEEELDLPVIVPPHPGITGAIGAALLVREEMDIGAGPSRFEGFDVAEADFNVSSLECKDCASACDISLVLRDGVALARWGGKCDLWEEEGS